MRGAMKMQTTLINGYTVLTLESGEKVIIHYNAKGKPIAFTDQAGKDINLIEWLPVCK